MNPPAGDPADPLVMLQPLVARRADELASHREPKLTALNLTCWLKAEEEIFRLRVAAGQCGGPT